MKTHVRKASDKSPTRSPHYTASWMHKARISGFATPPRAPLAPLAFVRSYLATHHSPLATPPCLEPFGASESEGRRLRAAVSSLVIPSESAAADEARPPCPCEFRSGGLQASIFAFSNPTAASAPSPQRHSSLATFPALPFRTKSRHSGSSPAPRHSSTATPPSCTRAAKAPQGRHNLFEWRGGGSQILIARIRVADTDRPPPPAATRLVARRAGANLFESNLGNFFPLYSNNSKIILTYCCSPC
jgi:hypothetical protein